MNNCVGMRNVKWFVTFVWLSYFFCKLLMINDVVGFYLIGTTIWFYWQVIADTEDEVRIYTSVGMFFMGVPFLVFGLRKL